jgi:CHAT domain-containing protein
MKNLLKYYAVLILSVSVGGCGSVMFHEQDRLAMGGQYSELERSSEDDKDISSAKSAILVDACISYSKLKRYNKLFACLDQLESNIKQGDKVVVHHGVFSWNYPENLSVVPALLKADAYIAFGDYEKSVSFAKAAYESLPTIEWTSKDRTNSWVRRFKIRSWGMLALAYALKGDNKQASQFVTQLENENASSAEFWLTPGGIQSAINKEKRFELARAYMAMGQYDRILADKGNFWDAFASVSEGMFGTMFAFVDLPIEFMTNKALYETGHIKEAKEGYDRLLSKPETKSNGEIYWAILLDRGKISQAEGNIKQAIDFYKQSIGVIESQRSTINTEASKIGFVGDKQAVYGRLIALFVEQGQVGEAFDYVERSKSRALVDMLASKKDFAAPVGDPEKVKLALAKLDAADLGTRVQDAGAKADTQLTGTRNLQVARDALQSAAPELSSLVTVTSFSSAELGSLVGADETLIEYYYNGGNLIAFVLNRAGLSVTKLDGINLDSQVQALRAAIEQTSTEAWQTPSRALYEKLWKPLEASIPTKNVIIVAHGSLHYLPFSVLKTADSSLLIDHVSMRYLPSASVLKFLHPLSAKKGTQLLVLGNPDLNDTRLDLKFAESEARLIAGMSKTSRLLVRLDASETNLKKTAGIFSRLHFATHGKFQAGDPLSSGLYLAKDVENDGVLTVGELYSMSLDADLVTLSACETGLGKVSNGDDVIGLTRGFLYAGSRSIVASLWSVDDLATATLMKAFYENLSSQNKQEALRLAQLKTRKTFPHPFYWAAFQLTGRTN